MTKFSQVRRILIWTAIVCASLVAAPRSNAQGSSAQARLIELTADSDSRYKIAGQRTPGITVKAGEQVLLRVTAHRAKSWNRDGSIHGFTLLRAKDRTKVDGWDLLFKPGTQEFTLTAPSEPGEYIVVCTVICSEDHEGMHMKFTVLP
jgi:heme/copper-type cytochrome/quinol oxidase subunit 2